MKKYLKKLKIGKLEVYPNIFLAPMAGITTKYFREILISLGGCGLTFSELISSEALIRNGRDSFKMMERGRGEFPYAVQIYGFNPEHMGDAAKIIEDGGYGDLIDINAGCPARKVVKNGSGSALLKDLLLFERIITTVKKRISLPVSVKMRSGFNTPIFLEAGKIAENSGASFITLHPRLRSEMFSGKSNWEYIRELKESVSIPVVGNGDIFSPEDGVRMFEKTGCDAIMIGRGITRDPFLIKNTYDFLKSGSYLSASICEKIKILLKILDAIDKNYPDKAKCGEMKRYSSYFIHGFNGASKVRSHIYLQKKSGDIISFVKKLYEKIKEEENCK